MQRPMTLPFSVLRAQLDVDLVETVGVADIVNLYLKYFAVDVSKEFLESPLGFTDVGSRASIFLSVDHGLASFL
jgi:hypothetical protein